MIGEKVTPCYGMDTEACNVGISVVVTWIPETLWRWPAPKLKPQGYPSGIVKSGVLTAAAETGVVVISEIMVA